MARIGIIGLQEELTWQRRALAGRSPPYERALAILPKVLAGAPGRFVEAAWEERRFFAWYARPLLLLSSLRYDALESGQEQPLHDAFAADAPQASAVTEESLSAALDGSRERVFDCLAHRTVRTTDTSAAVAWLWPAALAGASFGRRPLALAEVGASDGLRLIGDHLPPMWRAEDGSPIELAVHLRSVARLGLDRAPLDALDAEDARWLRACIWPGDRDRERRLEQAIGAFRAARVRPDAPVLVPIGPRNVPARLDVLSAAETGTLVLAYQTAVRDDLEPSEREEYEAGMRDWLGTHPAGDALWIELEPLGDGAALAGALVAHVRTPRGELRTIELARSSMQPRRLDVRRDGAAELRMLLGADAHAGARA